MSRFKGINPLVKRIIFATLFVAIAVVPHGSFLAPTEPSIGDYTAYPPFITENAPPLVMLVMPRDHKLYYEAYNDISDVNENEILDKFEGLDGSGGYLHEIDYYGYFDPYKCYTYSVNIFTPNKVTSDKYCGVSGEWSGNFLNWLSMSRMDIIKKVFYGGHRSQDDAAKTYLEGVYIPQDAHSWGKEYSASDANKLTPFGNPSSGKRHLFCMTSLQANDPHIIRVLENMEERVWQWASVERPVCDSKVDVWPKPGGDGAADTYFTPKDYVVRVKVCDSSVGLESNCRKYPVGPSYKPIGLLQKFGEGDGSGKRVCSKTFNTCTQDSDCTSKGEGLCIGKSQMYFGLMTGSYRKNLSGGVLRKNVWSIAGDSSDKDAEINIETGFFKKSPASTDLKRGSIINTVDTLKTVGFNYACPYCYDWNCGWIGTRPITEGECFMWGNPMAEMLYEATRYFADKGSATSAFTYTFGDDMGLSLPKPDWIKPYETFPTCSRPFILSFSDVSPSHDSDKVPGAYSGFGSFSGDLPGLNVSTLANKIGISEGIAGTYRFIGQSSGTLDDFVCSKKYVSKLSEIRGLCPEAPTKQGSFYSASIAYYGKTMMKEKTGKPDISTYTVALSSPIPDINIKVGNKFVRVVPIGKSVAGGHADAWVEGSCRLKCKFSLDLTDGKDNNSNGIIDEGLVIKDCRTDAFCPANQIVDIYVEEMKYDADKNVTKARFRINYEDVEQGADHDMDAIVFYEICSGTGCSPVIGSNQIKVKISVSQQITSIFQVFGFTISGTDDEDGTYLPVRGPKAGTDPTPSPDLMTMPQSWEKTFAIVGNPAGVLKDPLWYAAKWGGFEDLNGDGVPDSTKEWDADGDGDPDTYYLVVNPLKVEQQLEKAFADILDRSASGTAVSVLSTTGEGEGAVYQAYFYPKKMEGKEERKWLGYIHGLFLDPYGNLREDTNGNKTLDLTEDYIVRTVFDAGEGTKIERYSDSNGDGIADTYMGKVPIEYVNSVWNAGKRLWETNPVDRNIYTTTDGYTRKDFVESNWSILRPYLRASNTDGGVEATNIIKYIRGNDISGYRKRTVTIEGKTKVWKLGDIVYSTPTTVSKPMENYDLMYSDQTYNNFRQKYLNRRHVVYLGANDGMLHAFNGGFYDISKHKFCSAYSSGSTCPDSDSNPNEIGKELWGFIPRELLPHLKWLTMTDYTHVYYVDLKPKVTDARIFADDSTHPGGWGTILIGGMRYGGKKMTVTDPDFSGGSMTFYSSYFALDITDPEQSPRLLWTFTTEDLGLTLSYPTVLKIKKNESDAVGEWYAIFGSGPTSFTQNSDLAGIILDGKVFVLKLSGGDNGVIKSWEENTNYWKKPTGNSKAFLANPITIDVNTDYNVDVAYIGESYIQSTNNKAVMWRLNTKNTPEVSSWVLYPLYNVTSDNDKIKRITASPSAALDGKGNLWIYFGTGQFYGILDRNAADTGAFYGIRDNCWDGSCTTTYSELYDVSNVIINYGDNPAFNTILTNVGNKDGWAVYFGNMSAETTDFLGNPLQHAGERVTTKPVILAGYVMFATYVPGGDICSVLGTSNLYALYYKTGTAHTRYAFKAEREAAKETVSRVVLLGKGLPTSIGMAVTKEGKMKGFVQTSTGEIYPIQELDPSAPRPKYTGWKAGGVGGL